MPVLSPSRKQQGLAMAVVLFLLVTLALLTTAMLAAGAGSTRIARAHAPAPQATDTARAGLRVARRLLEQSELPVSSGPVYLAWPGSTPWASGDAHADPYASALSGTPQSSTLPSTMQSLFTSDLPGLQWVRLLPEMVPGTQTPRYFLPSSTSSTLLQVFQATAWVHEGLTSRMVTEELGWPQTISSMNPGTGSVNAIVPAALTLVGDNPTYTLPHSNNWTVSGYDLSNPSAAPVIALGGSSDAGANALNTQAVRPDSTHYPGADASSPNPSIINAVSAGMMSSSLATVTGLQQFVAQIRSSANYECGGYEPCPSTAGSGTGFLDAQSPRTTVIDGNFTLPSECTTTANCGGILLVTGTLSVPNNFQWDGLLMVIGNGVINFDSGSGGGSPVVRGAVFAANPCANLASGEVPHSDLDNCTQMGSAVLNTFNGGGNGVIDFDSALINQDIFSSSLARVSEPGGSGGSGSTTSTTTSTNWQVLSVSSFTPPN